jgi:hypothetical protein
MNLSVIYDITDDNLINYTDADWGGCHNIKSSLRLTSFFYMKVSLADVLNVSNSLLYSWQRLSTWLKCKLWRKPFDYVVFLVKLTIFMMTMYCHSSWQQQSYEPS